jgi:hypothetical protein
MTDWKDQAACAGQPWDRWTELPQVQLEVNRRYKATELAICADCSVTSECLEAGLKEPGGIWGGLFPKERRAIVRRRKESV